MYNEGFYTRKLVKMILYIDANTKKFTPGNNGYVVVLFLNTLLTFPKPSYKKLRTVNLTQENDNYVLLKTAHKGIYSWRIYIK